MDITHVSIRNFLTVGAAELQLDNRGLLLIQGENADDTSASSNGAGKSSLVDALCWCLYGETAREVSGDGVVNRNAKKDCMVEVILNDDGTEYKITRYRKDKTYKNQVFVYQHDDGVKAWIDLSKGTDKETQEVIRKVMGCSLDVFKGAIYAGQEAMPDLPGMTDKHLKLLIEEAAGVEELADAYTEASKLALTAKKDADAAVAYVRSTEQRLEGMEKELIDAQAQEKLFDDGRKDRARTELTKVPPLQAGITEAKTKMAGFDVAALNKRKAEIETELAGRKSQETTLNLLRVQERQIGNRVTAQRTSIGQDQARIKRLEQELADIESQVGKPCGECGKAYCEHDLDAARAVRKEAIEKDKAALLVAARDYKREVAAWGTAQEQVKEFEATMTDVSAVSAELTQINAELTTAAIFERSIIKLEADIETVKAAAKAKLSETNPWTKAVESKSANIEQCKKEIGLASTAAAKLEEKADLYASAAKVFGPAGVRAHILDTVTPFLNERTTDYLGALADGNIHAQWSTLAPTAKGDLKEKFNIDVTHDKGGDTFKGLSGGEKRKVRIATNMALQDMVASRAEKPINLWIGDEIDHALDEPGLERLMTVLDRKAKERGTVVVISHNSLSDWIDNVIHVKKSGGQSTASGATHRGF